MARDETLKPETEDPFNSAFGTTFDLADVAKLNPRSKRRHTAAAEEKGLRNERERARGGRCHDGFIGDGMYGIACVGTLESWSFGSWGVDCGFCTWISQRRSE